MHFFTCEIFNCEECERKKFNQILDIKDHMKNEHSDGYLIHAKQSRANSEEIEMTEYRKKYFMTNY